MMPFRRVLGLSIALCLLATGHNPARGDAQDGAAANYIRALFDTSMGGSATPAQICPQIVQFGRFAAGHSWQSLSVAEQSRLQDGFCALAVEAIHRLAGTYPNLRLQMGQVSQAPQEMLLAATVVQTSRPAQNWPVDWQIARVGGGFRIADLRLLGISLGIFLRSLVPTFQETPTAADILAPWWRALDRAFPPQSTPPAAAPP